MAGAPIGLAPTHFLPRTVALYSGGDKVKGGRNVPLGHIRDFRHVLTRESAACGVFATLLPLTSPKAKAEAKGAGYFEVGVNRYPKAQLWSIADYFQDRLPVLPPLADPYTGKAMQYDLFQVEARSKLRRQRIASVTRPWIIHQRCSAMLESVNVVMAEHLDVLPLNVTPAGR